MEKKDKYIKSIIASSMFILSACGNNQQKDSDAKADENASGDVTPVSTLEDSSKDPIAIFINNAKKYYNESDKNFIDNYEEYFGLIPVENAGQ